MLLFTKKMLLFTKKMLLFTKISKDKKIFGNKNPIGQIIQTNERDFCVSAVANDIPANTQLQWNILAPIENQEKTDPNFLSWTQGGYCYTFLLLKENGKILIFYFIQKI